MPELSNRLPAETSPYLLQHAQNPVHWQPWDPEALASARSLDRPILLSIGYAACHWCHVMAHESFEDDDTAALMNTLFVNIKVDREERPDIDAIYMQALHHLGEHGGWPLTMFLTPEARPFWGGTYFPPEPRHGRPSFRQVLAGVAAIYADEPHKVASNASALTTALQSMAGPRQTTGASPVGETLLDAARHALLKAMDRTHGGLRGAPKFPQFSQLRFLWNEWRRTGDANAREAVRLTMDRIAQGGITDHLGGGISRYSVDDRWLVPHFEKMLYDNAGMLEMLALLHADDPSNPLWRRRAEDLVGWLTREMMTAPDALGDAAFASSLDADSEGEEGRFYVWTRPGLRAALEAAGFSATQIDAFQASHDVTDQGNWEGHVILNRTASPLREPATEARFDSMRQALLLQREGRIRPGIDDKVLADWNGLMIAALARAGSVFDRPDWLAAATSAFRFVAHNLAMPDNRLWHSWRGGVTRNAGMLADHAAMARAGLALHAATADPAPRDAALAWTGSALDMFLDRNDNAFFTTARDATDILVRAKDATDQAVPSGNGLMADVLAQLWLTTHEARHRDAAENLIQAWASGIAEQPWSHGWMMVAHDALTRGLTVSLAGPAHDPASLRLLAAAHSIPEVAVPLILLDPADPTDPPSAFLCRDQACGLPATNPALLLPPE